MHPSPVSTPPSGTPAGRGGGALRLVEVFRFELVYQLRRRSTWLYLAVGAVMASFAASGFVDDARSGGFPVDAPIVVAVVTVLAGLFGLLATAPVAGDAAVRDGRTRMAALLDATPLTPRDRSLGRFGAALVLGALFAAAVPAGLALLVRVPGFADGLAGPFRPGAYAGALLLVGLPNAFVATALLFTAATLGRRVGASYLCGGLLFLATMLSKELLADHLGLWRTASMLDPLGLSPLGVLWDSWSSAERGVRTVVADPALLANRALWVAIAGGALALACRPTADWHIRGLRRGAARRGEEGVDTPGAAAERTAPVALPRVERRFGAAGRARQVLAVTRASCRRIVTGPAFLAVPAAALLLVVTGPELAEGPLDTATVPLTARILPLLDDFTLGVLVAALTSWFAGALVWGEREVRLAELAGAAPVPDGVALGGRFLSLGLVLVAVQASFASAGVLIQALAGHFRFEPEVYARALFDLQLVDRLLFAALALVVHVAVDQKYVGHLAVMLVHFWAVFAPSLGVEHHLLAYGSVPGWAYSDLAGFGASLAPHRWLQLHWAGWALVGLAVASRLWVRGRGREPLPTRLRRCRRPGRAVAGALAIGVLVACAIGAHVLRATEGPNDRASNRERDAARATYEGRYGEHAGDPQPVVAATRLQVAIDPGSRRVRIAAAHRLRNDSGEPIGVVHLTTHPEVATGAARLDRPAHPVLVDDRLGFRSYRLETPLRPGESLGLEIDVRVAPRGFPIDGVDTSVTRGSVLFEHLDVDGAAGRHWLPWVGYRPSRELYDPGARRKHGLSERPAAPLLDDPAARRYGAGREWIDFEAVIATAADHVAVAPGRLVRSWSEGDRRYFHYATEAPIRNAWAIASAPYAVHEAHWRGVAIEILHHPGHRWNLERTVRAARASLEAYSRRFGEYPHRWLRFVEIPGVGTGLRAYPGTILFSEGFAASEPAIEAGSVDLPFAVVAHEVAHQWWGHRLVPAPVEGAPVLTESLAWYSAVGVVEEAQGGAALERLLDLMRSEYGKPHAAREVPLLRATDWLDTYRTGPLAMQELRDRIGGERVDRALRRLLARHATGEPPYPTTLDLYRELRIVTPKPLLPFLRGLLEEVPRPQALAPTHRPPGRGAATADASSARGARASSPGGGESPPRRRRDSDG